MKKVLFLLAFVAVYGVALATTQAAQETITETIVVVDNNDNVEKEEGKKAKGEAKSGECADKKAAKSDCKKSCDGKKSAEAKKDCSKSCDGKK